MLKLWERELFTNFRDTSRKKRNIFQINIRVLFRIDNDFNVILFPFFWVSRVRRWHVLPVFARWIGSSVDETFRYTYMYRTHIYKLILTQTLWEYKYDSYINREINNIHLYCVRNKKKKRREPVYYLITWNHMIRHIQYSTNLLFSSPFFVVSSFERSLIRFL